MTDKSYYKTRFDFYKKRNKVWRVLANYLQKYIPINSKVLDLGAGYCNFINNIKCKEKHALDLYKGFIKYAHSNVKTYIQSCTNLNNFYSNHFDIIHASNLFEHLTKQEFEKTLKGIKRILKNGGKLIIIQPNYKYAYKEYFDDYTHKTIHTDKSLCDVLIANGFKIIKCIPKFIPFSMKSKIPTSTFLLKLYLYSPFKPFAKQMLIIAQK